MTQPTAPAASQQRGLPYALGAYAIWGFVPLFFKLLETVPPVEALARYWAARLIATNIAAAKR